MAIQNAGYEDYVGEQKVYAYLECKMKNVRYEVILIV